MKAEIGNMRLLAVVENENAFERTPFLEYVRENKDCEGMIESIPKAFGHTPRHFEPWSNDELPPASILTIIPRQQEDAGALDIFNGHRSPTWRVFSGNMLELMTRLPRVRYLDHVATKARNGVVTNLYGTCPLIFLGVFGGL
ncbi:hypothetical protein TNCV_3851221 [Trichonephila clavipes]|nr:hypothetical protein TNCV_3851221 [Trichonephila clavipes]